MKRYNHQHSWKDGLYLLIPQVLIAAVYSIRSGTPAALLDIPAATTSGLAVLVLMLIYWHQVALKLTTDTKVLTIHYDDPIVGGYWRIPMVDIESVRLSKRHWIFRWILTPVLWNKNLYLWMRGAHKVTIITKKGDLKKIVFILDDELMAKILCLELEGGMITEKKRLKELSLAKPA